MCHLGFVDYGDPSLLGVKHNHVGALNLAEEVTVAARDLDRRFYLRRERGDDVLGFIPLEADHVDPDRSE